MHPILNSRRRLAVYVLAWIPMSLLLVAAVGRATPLVAAALLVPTGILYAFISLSSWYVCRTFPVDARTRVISLVLVHVAVAVVASAIWIAVGSAWGLAIDALFGAGAVAFYAQQRPFLFVVGALLFWLAVVFHYLLIAVDASREAETRALELSLLAREAELKALRAQIDPHFIFNSLHSISALTSTDPPAARRMCLLLADFLRDTLRLGSTSRISLADEFALAERFLAIEQVRLGARLQVSRDTDADAIECLVPPLVLQPLVENAVVHGVAQLVEGGTIRMAAARDGSSVRITLENPCDPDRPRTRGVGLGLELLKRRLATQFGAYDAVRAEERSGRFRVEVRIPVVIS
jgi:two-component system, LytTR family, sensor histidine kinase AlgZ